MHCSFASASARLIIIHRLSNKDYYSRPAIVETRGTLSPVWLGEMREWYPQFNVIRVLSLLINHVGDVGREIRVPAFARAFFGVRKTCSADLDQLPFLPGVRWCAIQSTGCDGGLPHRPMVFTLVQAL